MKRLYVLFFLELASRRILFTACSEHVGGAWAAQQARNLAWQLQEAEVKPRFLIHDRDANFPAGFDAVFRSEGLEVIRTPVRAPNANAIAERWVASARREALDWLLVLNDRHLRCILKEYVEHYHRTRPHRSLELRPPTGDPPLGERDGQVMVMTRLGGLLREYSRAAAWPQDGCSAAPLIGSGALPRPRGGNAASGVEAGRSFFRGSCATLSAPST